MRFRWTFIVALKRRHNERGWELWDETSSLKYQNRYLNLMHVELLSLLKEYADIIIPNTSKFTVAVEIVKSIINEN